DELGAAAPAVRIAVGDRLCSEQQVLLAQVLDDGLGDNLDGLPGQPVEPVDIDAEVVERRDDGQPELFAEEEILLTTAGRDVDDAGAFLLANLIPRNHAMLDALLGG